MVAKPAPNKDANEENPRHLRMLDKEPGEVMRLFNPLLIADVWHRGVYLGNDFDGFSILQELGADSDHIFACLYSHDGYRGLMGRA